MAFLANLRSTIAYQTNGSTISTGSVYQAATGGVPRWTNSLVSSIVSIGASTNQTYTTMSQGNFSTSTNWISTLTGRSSTIGVSMSANAQTQLVVSQVSTATSIQYTNTLGQTWATLSGATGLPSATTTNYSAGALSGNGQYGILATYGGYLYTTANSGASWTNTNPNTGSLYAQLSFEGNTNDVSGNGRTVTVSPSVPGYVPGIVGKNALNLVNASGATATQYIRIPWSGATNFTFSGWFNVQSFLSPYYARIVNTYSNGVYMAVRPDATLYCVFPSGGGTSSVSIEYGAIALNTWYNYTIIFQTNGLCSFYINNRVVGTITNTSGVGSFTSANISLGCTDTSTGDAFNGYMDDFKVYNSAITFTPMVPQNWSNVALSNSGQYMLATVTNSGLYLSSNFGSIWSQVTGAMLQALWTSAQISATGQYMLANSQQVIVQPNLTGLISTVAERVSWQKNGITWIASSSSNNDLTQSTFKAFNNTTGDAWLSNNTTPRYNPDGTINANAASTYLYGSGTIRGEYLQIQSSVPVVMHSFALGIGLNTWPSSNVPKTYHIIGSNDSINWYTLQTGTTNFSAWTLASSYVLINQSGAQVLSGTSSGNITTAATSYYATQPYTYFRLVGTSLNNAGGQNSTYMEIGEWYINFQAGGQAYSTNYGSTWDTALPLYNIVQPQLTGLAASTWNQSGVSWTASASTTLSSTYNAYNVFNNKYGGVSNFSWANGATSYTSTTNTAGSSTTIIGITQTPSTGDWVQIQSSVPVVLYSYQLGIGGQQSQMPQTFYIAGSNDLTNWYPIQYASIAAVSNTAVLTLIPSVILTNTSGSQTFGNTTLTATTYATTANAYTYFRLIARTIFNATSAFLEIGQWVLTFTTGTQTTQSLSPSGLTALTGYTAGTISPQKTGLTSTTWNQSGVNWIASASTVLDPVFSPYYIFDNNFGINNRWVPSSETYYTTGNNSGVFTTILGGVGSIQGDWIQLQSSIPLIMSSYQFANGYANTRLPKTYYIIGSNNGTDWSPIQSGSGSTVPTIDQYTIIPSIIIVNNASVQPFGTSTITTTTYLTTTTAYRYFRLLCVANYSPGGYIDIGEWIVNFTTASTISLYNIISPITNMLTGSVVTAGTIPGTITGSAVSNTGQYMVVITNATSGNNVYYSTNTGATFTGLQLGSLPMTSAAISYDGSYITVSNATTVYQLNNNATGYTVAVGNQAGQVNQGVNAIAIGNYAGTINQTGNSIILNASGLGTSGQGLNAYSNGFYVAPIASYVASPSASYALLAYGADNQIVQTGITSLYGANGFVGIGTTAPVSHLTVYSTGPTGLSIGSSATPNLLQLGIAATPANYSMHAATGDSIIRAYHGNLMLQSGSGASAIYINTNNFVGIGMANPSMLLSVGSYGGMMGGTSFSGTAPGSGIATGLTIPAGTMYLVSCAGVASSGGSNDTWYNTSLVQYGSGNTAGVVRLLFNANITIACSATGVITISLPGGNGTQTFTINASRLC